MNQTRRATRRTNLIVLAPRRGSCRVRTTMSSAAAATATAPGRIDFLGGVGDYSGSLVLQVATAAVTTVRATLAPHDGAAADEVLLSSPVFGDARVSLAALREAVDAAPRGGALSPSALRAVRAFLAEAGAAPWVAYVFGCVAAFALETGWLPPRDAALALAISSEVPLAQGVSSSASVEVATLRALGAVSGGRALGALRLAHVAQATENYVVGAPCGLMDQLASALGAPGAVLPILCRPDALSPVISLPRGVVVVGWPSGVEHSVGASPYLRARTAAFMAKKALERARGAPLAHLTELAPSELRALEGALPAAVTGAAFTDDFGAVDDALSVVRAEETYDLRAAASFPIEENFRCARGEGGAQPRGGRAVTHNAPTPPIPSFTAAAPSRRRCSRASRTRPRRRRARACSRSSASACGRRTAATRRLASAAPSSTS
jgi:galactokinase